jgi:hypothetical protein
MVGKRCVCGGGLDVEDMMAGKAKVGGSCVITAIIIFIMIVSTCMRYVAVSSASCRLHWDQPPPSAASVQSIQMITTFAAAAAAAAAAHTSPLALPAAA